MDFIDNIYSYNMILAFDSAKRYESSFTPDIPVKLALNDNEREKKNIDRKQKFLEYEKNRKEVGEKTFKEFSNVKKEQRKEFLENLIKSKKIIEKDSCKEGSKECIKKWETIAGSREIYKVWQDSLSKYNNREGAFQTMAVFYARQYCSRKNNEIKNNNKVDSEKLRLNPFGSSLDSTKELTRFIISDLLFELKKDETIHYNNEVYGNRKHLRGSDFLEPFSSKVESALFFMDFLDGLNKLKITSKSNDNSIC